MRKKDCKQLGSYTRRHNLIYLQLDLATCAIKVVLVMNTLAGGCRVNIRKILHDSLLSIVCKFASWKRNWKID